MRMLKKQWRYLNIGILDLFIRCYRFHVWKMGRLLLVSSDSGPYELHKFIVAQRYAPILMEAGEAARVMKNYRRAYYTALAQEAFHLHDRAFWQYHNRGLDTSGQSLDRPYLAFQIGVELLRKAANPGRTITHALRALSRKWESRAKVPAHEEQVLSEMAVGSQRPDNSAQIDEPRVSTLENER